MTNVKDWIITPLDKLFTPENDKSKQIKSSEYQITGAYPVIDQSSKFVCGFYDDKTCLIKSELPYIVFGDHTRHTKYIDFPFIAGADGTQILKANSKIYTKFLYYVVCYASKRIGNYGYDRHFKHLKEYICSIPESMEEQKQIAKVLSCLDKTIEQTEAIIAKQQRVKTGLMQDLLTKGIDEQGNIRSEETHEFKDSPLGRIPVEWNTDTLENTCIKVTDGIHQKVEISESGIPFLYVSCVRDGRIYWNRAANITPTTYKVISKGCEAIQGVILYTVVGSYGYAAVVTDDRKFAFQRHIAYIRPNEEIFDSQFLMEWLISPIIKKKADESALGNAQKTITLSELRAFPVITMDKREQQGIVELLGSFSEKIYKEEASLLKLNKIKQGLMQDLLTGKVRVNNLIN